MEFPKRCVDLTEEHVDRALRSRDVMQALLTHMALIARPHEGAAKILVPVARIATTACRWLEGALHVELEGLPRGTALAISSDIGGGVFELIFPRMVLGVDFDEIADLVKLAPGLVAPLKSRAQKKRMILTPSALGTLAPPPFEVAEECLRRSLPPKLRRSLPPLKPSPAKQTEETVEGAILARLLPKSSRTLAFPDGPGLDVGWEAGSYSSAAHTRDTKPPPVKPRTQRGPLPKVVPPKRRSKAPPRPSKAPPKPSKPPPTPSSKPPRPSKAPPKPSKAPPKPSKPPALPEPKPPALPKPKPPALPEPKPPALPEPLTKERTRPAIRKSGEGPLKPRRPPSE